MSGNWIQKCKLSLFSLLLQINHERLWCGQEEASTFSVSWLCGERSLERWLLWLLYGKTCLVCSNCTHSCRPAWSVLFVFSNRSSAFPQITLILSCFVWHGCGRSAGQAATEMDLDSLCHKKRQIYSKEFPIIKSIFLIYKVSSFPLLYPAPVSPSDLVLSPQQRWQELQSCAGL